jgi:hypothetical protein
MGKSSNRMSVRVFILRRQGGEDGPYSEEHILDALEAGDLSPDEWCRIDDQPQAQRLAEVFEQGLGREGEDEEEDEKEDEKEDEDEEDEEDEEEEAIVYEGSPSLLGYGWTLGVAGLVLAAGYWLGRFGVKWVTGALAVALVLVVRLLVHRASREYLVTTERVQETVGLVSKTTRQIPLRALASIRLHRPWPMGWLGVGTVIFSSDAGPSDDVVFERVGRVRKVIATVREWQRR